MYFIDHCLRSSSLVYWNMCIVSWFWISNFVNLFPKIEIQTILMLNLWLVVVMVHPNAVHDVVPEATIYMDVKPSDVYVDIGKQFTNKPKFVIREHMLQWVRIEASKLGFAFEITRSNFDSDRRQTFVTMRFEIKNLSRNWNTMTPERGILKIRNLSLTWHWP